MSGIASMWEPAFAGAVARAVEARTSIPLEMEVVRDEAGIESLRPYWDGLVERSATVAPFMRFEWMRLWSHEFRAEYSPCVVVLKDGLGEPQAIAPLMLGRGTRGREHLRVLGFLGGLGHAQGERMDFIVPRGREAELAPLLCSAFRTMRSEWDAVHLAKVPEESPNLPHILFALGNCADDAGVLNRHPCRFMHLPASWEEYEMGMSGAWRSKFRRRWKSMVNEHHAVVGLAGTDVLPTDAMHGLHDLHELNWPCHTSLFTRPEAWSFHQRLAERWVPEGRMVLLTVAIDGRAAAVVMGFVERGEFFQFQHGWDPAYSRLSIGRLAMHASIQHAIARGLCVYDMMPGEFDYKTHLCKDVRHVLDIEAFNPLSLRARIFRSLRGFKRLVPDHKQEEPQTAAGVP